LRHRGRHAREHSEPVAEEAEDVCPEAGQAYVVLLNEEAEDVCPEAE
jgi:hypothetical protein